MKIRWRYALLALLLAVVATPSFADEVEDLRKLRDSTISLINQLVQKGVLTRAQADAIIAQAEQAGAGSPATGAPGAAPAPASAAAAPSAAAPAAPPGEVRVPYVPEVVEQEITQQIKQDVLSEALAEHWGAPGAYPDWLRRITFFGDMRFRFQAERYPIDNTPNAPAPVLQSLGVNVTDSTTPENLLRIRARFGLQAALGDTVTTGIRFATGGVGLGSNPATENQTLGNYASNGAVGLDRAFIAYHPLKWVAFTLGRLGNPFFAPTTLVWANDISLEGAVANLGPDLTRYLEGFATAGFFPILQETPSPTNSSPSKWLYAYQGGFVLHPKAPYSLRLAAAYYDYLHIQGVPNPNIYTTQYSGTAAPFRQTGNTVFDIDALANTFYDTQNYLWGLASQFREINISSSLDVHAGGTTHVILDGDYVRNIGFNQQEILQRTGYLVQPDVAGWQTMLTVGDPDPRLHAWQAFVGYRDVQGDATVDAFTDSDFHGGGTDAKGFIVGGSFFFATNTAIRFRWLQAKDISGLERAGISYTGTLPVPLAIDWAQLEVTSAF